jgi:hypothetical protein
VAFQGQDREEIVKERTTDELVKDVMSQKMVMFQLVKRDFQYDPASGAMQEQSPRGAVMKVHYWHLDEKPIGSTGNFEVQVRFGPHVTGQLTLSRDELHDLKRRLA